MACFRTVHLSGLPVVVGAVQEVYLLVPERALCPLGDHPCSFCVVCEGGGEGRRREGGEEEG